MVGCRAFYNYHNFKMICRVSFQISRCNIKPIGGVKAPFLILNAHNWQQLLPVACRLILFNAYLSTHHIVNQLMFLWPRWMFSRQSFVKSVHVQTLVRGWLAFLVFNRAFHQTLFTLIGFQACTCLSILVFPSTNRRPSRHYLTKAPPFHFPISQTPQCQCVSVTHNTHSGSFC